MAVTLGAAAAKAVKTVVVEAAKDPGKFSRACCAIAIGAGAGIALIVTILCSTVSSFFGESLPIDGTQSYAATIGANNDISDYMSKLINKALEEKDSIIERKKVTTTYTVYGERHYSSYSISNRINQLKEYYSQTPDLISCNVTTHTETKYLYTISGKTPDGRNFSEEKEFWTEEEVEAHIANRFQFGYKNLTRTRGTPIYYVNFYTAVTICEIDFEEDWRTIPTSYILAYQSTVVWRGGNLQRPQIEKTVISNFLSSASPFRVNDQSDTAAKKVIFSNETVSPEELANILWPDDIEARAFFLASQKSYASMLKERSLVYVDFDFVNISLPIHDYYQTNYRNVSYGNGTIASSGCGPTCIAMLTTYYKGIVTTPPEVCSWCEAIYYIPGAGTAWSVFPGAAEHYGYSCTNLGLDYAAVLEAVATGHPVVGSMGPGTFTSEGHYILIVGMTTSGELIINDPNERNVTKYGTDKFSAETVLGEAKNFWAFGP